MQNIIVLKPYRFVPPHPSSFWIRALDFYLPLNLKWEWGLHAAEYRGTEYLKESLAAGHGIILAPNHCRPFDPLTVGMLGSHMRQPVFTMASWHLFMEGRFKRWLIRRIGAFSIYREGVDREALKAATAMLVDARRPLVMFAEGIVSRTNDRLNPLQDGVAFIARSAAKLRARATPAGKVVVHPVFLRYYFEGDLAASVTPVLDKIENRLSWRPQKHLSLFERVRKIGEGLLALKEVEYLGDAQPGTIAERLSALIERILVPLEKEWLSGYRDPSVIERVKRLRMAIVPEMITGSLSQEEMVRRWRKLGDAYLAQQLYCYPPEYLTETSPPERLLETVERFEEDLDDVARIHRPLRVLISVAPAIEVNPTRERGVAEDPLMKQVRESLEQMMQATRREARPS
jgi:1-acyl-sn-glycerol-3-phosphate acyltransferase